MYTHIYLLICLLFCMFIVCCLFTCSTDEDIATETHTSSLTGVHTNTQWLQQSSFIIRDIVRQSGGGEGGGRYMYIHVYIMYYNAAYIQYTCTLYIHTILNATYIIESGCGAIAQYGKWVECTCIHVHCYTTMLHVHACILHVHTLCTRCL